MVYDNEKSNERNRSFMPTWWWYLILFNGISGAFRLAGSGNALHTGQVQFKGKVEGRIVEYAKAENGNELYIYDSTGKKLEVVFRDSYSGKEKTVDEKVDRVIIYDCNKREKIIEQSRVEDYDNTEYTTNSKNHNVTSADMAAIEEGRKTLERATQRYQSITSQIEQIQKREAEAKKAKEVERARNAGRANIN